MLAKLCIVPPMKSQPILLQVKITFVVCFFAVVNCVFLRADANERWSKRYALPGLSVFNSMSGYAGTARAIVRAGNVLAIAGEFSVPTGSIGLWDLTNERWIETELNLQPDSSGHRSEVRGVFAEGDSMFVYGHFATDTSHAQQNIAIYHCAQRKWSFPPVLFGSIEAMYRIGDKLVAVGLFDSSATNVNVRELVHGKWQHSLLEIPQASTIQLASLRDTTYALVCERGLTYSLKIHNGSGWILVADSILIESTPAKNVQQTHMKASADALYLYGNIRRLRTSSSEIVRAAGVFRYHRGAWQALCHDIHDSATMVVRDLIDSLGSVWICGSFQSVDKHLAQNVARYDTALKQWYGLGSGVSASSFLSQSVNCLCVVDNDIVAGGCFTTAGQSLTNSVARYAPSKGTWSAFAKEAMGLSDIASVKMLDNRLHLFGNFRYSGVVECNGMAEWSGSSWGATGVGFVGGPARTTKGAYYVMTGHFKPGLYFAERLGDTLFYSGLFDAVNGMKCSNLVGWDGQRAVAVDSGLSMGNFDDPYNFYIPAAVTSMLRFGNALYFCGDFSRAANKSADGVACWDGRSWQSLVNHITFDSRKLNESYSWLRLAVDSSHKLLLGGRFYKVDGVVAHGLAQWDGLKWQDFTKNSDYSVSNFSGLGVLADGRVMISAHIRTHEKTIAHGPAVWNGVSWKALGPIDTNASVPVIYCMLQRDSLLYVGGTFDSISTIVAHNVASYHLNSDQWTALGSGLQSDIVSSTQWLNRRVVNSIVAKGDTIVFAGDFCRAGGRASYFIAEWMPQNTVSVPAEDDIYSESGLELFPNPAAATVELRFDLESEQSCSLDVVDAMGRPVKQELLGLLSAGTHQISVDLSSMLPSVYSLCLRTRTERRIATLCVLR